MTNFLEYLVLTVIALVIGYYVMTTYIAKPMLEIVIQTAERITKTSR